MRTIDTSLIAQTVYQLALLAGKNLTQQAASALSAAAAKERNQNARFALSTYVQNAQIARETGLPVCQDTGMCVVFLEIGQDVKLAGEFLGDAVNGAVARAYQNGYFRKSVCDPLTRQNTGDNTPAVLHVEIVKGDKVKITVLPKGFGSENMSKLYMLTPSKGTEGIIQAVVDTVKAAGANPCPPVYVGVGIGGTFDGAALLSKKALLRPVGSTSPREDVASIETECLNRINALGIGAQGFGGDVTALGVSVETGATHIAGLPVAVNIQCHCVRAQSQTL